MEELKHGRAGTGREPRGGLGATAKFLWETIWGEEDERDWRFRFLGFAFGCVSSETQRGSRGFSGSRWAGQKIKKKAEFICTRGPFTGGQRETR